MNNFVARPHYYLSKALCVVAYNINENGKAKPPKNSFFYILRICIYSTLFVVGNFFVSDVIYTTTLDKIAFLFANITLIMLTIYIMIWSIIYKKQHINIIYQLDNTNGKYLEWIEVSLLIIYYLSITGVLIYSSNLVLIAKYCILFVLPDVFHYTALFQFINIITALRRKILILNKNARKEINFKKLANDYQHLYLLTTEVNKLYGVLCLWTVATFFTWIMCDLYRSMNYLKEKVKKDEIFVAGLIASFAHYISLFYISALCNSTKVEGINFKTIFYKTIFTTKQKHSYKKRLCLSLLSQNIQLTALDLFEIDYLLIYTISGAIVSYLVLFEQLHL